MKRTSVAVAGVLLWALCRIAAAQPIQDSEDWADSPEAYFMTNEERAQWKALDSRESRATFQERYWLKRDSTPGTEKNEFKDLVLGRIKVADQRFGIEKTPGSRTARGYVFIIFGSPARVRDSHAPRPEAPRFPASTTGPLEGNETLAVWMYDRDRTPRILEALDRPSLEIEIMIEPSRHSDSIQKPGLVKELREKLARKTIVNPDLIPSGPVEVAAAPTPVVAPTPLPKPLLDAAQRQLLEKAPFAPRTGDTVFGDAVIWRDDGEAEAFVWFALPPSPTATKRFLHGVVKKQNGGEEVTSISEPAVASNAFSTAVPGEVFLKRLSLPPGEYELAFAVTEGSVKPVGSASVMLAVPDLGSGFVVSPLILSRGPGARPGSGEDAGPFAIGRAVLPPRADATFSARESLWFFLEMANAPDPSKVTLELRIRKGAEAVSSRPAFPAELDTFAGGRSLCGFELPLEGIPPGDYRLYVLVRDGVSPEPVVRSADFRLKP